MSYPEIIIDTFDGPYDERFGIYEVGYDSAMTTGDYDYIVEEYERLIYSTGEYQPGRSPLARQRVLAEFRLQREGPIVHDCDPGGSCHC